MRKSILWALLACIALVGMMLKPPTADACSPVYVPIGFWPHTYDPLQDVPLQGSWAAIGSYGTNETSQDPAFDMRVLNENDEPVDGHFKVIPYGHSVNFYGKIYEQDALVTWTPDQELQPNHYYRVFFADLYNAETPPDDAYDERGSFQTGETRDVLSASKSLSIAGVQAAYVDTPAHDRQCVEKEPCPSSCGCETYRWSTRYFRIPSISLELWQQGDGENTQFYHVVEDADGTMRNLFWRATRQIHAMINLDHGDEAPIALTVHTYALDGTEPIATLEYIITEEDLPPLKGTDMVAEDTPKKCRNRSAVVVHNDGYKAPPSGCSSATSTPASSMFLMVILSFLLLFRFRSATEAHGIEKDL